MRIRFYPQALDAGVAVIPFLMRDEAANSVALGVFGAMRRDPARYPVAHFWSAEDEEGTTVGGAWHTPPHPIGLTDMPSAAAPLLVSAVAASASAPTRVFGPPAVAGRFKDLWCAARGVAVVERTGLRLLRAEQVIPPPFAVEGTMRVAASSDRDLLLEWSEAFCADCGLSTTPDELRRSVDSTIGNGVRFLWNDDAARPVAMAGVPVSDSRVARIGWVYTPPALRGRGFATALVAALTRSLLAQGRICVLHTDAANPTSNGIYERIGYRQIGESVAYSFG